MVSISLLLHLHQPPTQFPEVLRRVTDQCYRPLVNLLSKYPSSHLTINLTRSLVEQLESVNLAIDVIPLLKEAVARGQVELTGTAAYHILLPKLPKEEIVRQIQLNEETLYKYLGVAGPLRSQGIRNKELGIREGVSNPNSKFELPNSLSTQGFFPPEMGIDPTATELLKDLGYQWVIVDEGAVDLDRHCDPALAGEAISKRLPRRGLLAMTEDGMTIVVRNKELSLKLAFGVVTTVEKFLAAAKPYALAPKPSLVIALDGETFGHHQPALMPFLEELVKKAASKDREYQMLTVSEMISDNIRENQSLQSVQIISSTWGDDWLKWDNPENEIHQLQWKLTNLAIETVKNSKSTKDDAWLTARTLLDRALHSDQYWWASLRPNWHYQIVERGAKMLRDVVLSVPEVSGDAKLAAERLYEQITRTGRIKYGETVIV
ncbi:MAG: hypothetical protein AAB486_03395 [Patescibacteria group bacterium]